MVVINVAAIDADGNAWCPEPEDASPRSERLHDCEQRVGRPERAHHHKEQASLAFSTQRLVSHERQHSIADEDQ